MALKITKKQQLINFKKYIKLLQKQISTINQIQTQLIKQVENN